MPDLEPKSVEDQLSLSLKQPRRRAIKVVASYYSRMPGNKIPYMKQHEAIFEDLKKIMKESYPGLPVKTGLTMYPETIEKAINEHHRRER